MRAAGLALLVFALALGGEAFAHSWPDHSSPTKFCYRAGTAFKPGDFCYTSCEPTAACELEMCDFDGAFLMVGACKTRDCRKLC
jgi:hypothetical protein